MNNKLLYSNKEALDIISLLSKRRTFLKVRGKIIKKQHGIPQKTYNLCRLICQGLSNKGISGKLHIREYTVKDHIKNIMGKMKVNSRCKIIATILFSK